MSGVMFDRFDAESPANFGVFSVTRPQICPELPVAIIRVSRDPKAPLDGANIAAAQLLGYELPRRLIRATPFDLFVDPNVHREIATSLLYAKNGTAVQDCQLRRKNGSLVWVRVQAQAVRDPENEPGQINLVLIDISDRKSAEESLRKSDERFRSLLNNAGAGILIIDPLTRRIVSGNVCLGEMLGYSVQEFEKLPLGRIHSSESMLIVEQQFEKQKRGEITRARAIELVRKDGRIRFADVHAFTLSLDGKEAVIQFVHDATDRMQAEGEAKEYQERLRSLALEQSLAEERERRRVAGHLHDEVGQLLSLAQIRLSIIEPSVMHPECQKGAREMQKLLDRALRATRSLTFQLSHPAVYDLGFLAGAEWLADDIKDLYSLDVKLIDDRAPKPLDLRCRVLLLQCMRELLVNVAKHAGTKAATVQVARIGESVRVMVEDCGVGFDSQNLRGVTEMGGFGLFSIRERLRGLGGTIEIESASGLGTCVTLVVPIALNGSKERSK